MLINYDTVADALLKVGVDVPVDTIIQATRPLLVHGRTNVYTEGEKGRFKTTLVRDSKGRIAATRPQRVA